MVHQSDTDRNSPSPHRSLSEWCKIGDSLYVTGTIGDALAGLKLLNEPPTRVRRHSRTATLSAQAPAIFDRTPPAPNCARRGRPVAQHPWLRNLGDRYFRRPVRRPSPHLRGKPCRGGGESQRTPLIAGLPRLCRLSKTRSIEPGVDGRRGL